MKRAVLWLSLLLPGCGSAPERVSPGEIEALRDASQAAAASNERNDRTEWHVHLDTRASRLGAYTILLRYNAAVARIHEIRPCDERPFKGAPEFDPDTFAAGATRVTSLDAFPARAPEGEYHLLTVIFERTATGTLEAEAVVEKAYDDDDRPIQVRIVRPRFTYAFP